MKFRKLILATALMTTVGLVGTATQPATGHAAYRWTKVKNYSGSLPYHQKKKGTTAYMWNAKHTKKLHNLKHYPKTTWYLSKSVKMTQGKKSSIYYRVTSGNKKVTGYVWHGYLSPGDPFGNRTAPVQNNTPKSGNYSYPSKGIYYSTLPYASTYQGTKVDDYDPATTEPSKWLQTMTTATINANSPKLTTDQVNTIVSYENSHGYKGYQFRIVDLPVLGSNGKTTIPAVETFTAPVDDPDYDQTLHGEWAEDPIPAASILAQAQYGKGTPSSTSTTSITDLIGPFYAFPDDKSVFIQQADWPLDLTSFAKLATKGDFTLITTGNNRTYYVKTSDLLTLSETQPTKIHGIWFTPADSGSQKADMQAQLIRDGATSYREIQGCGFWDYKLVNGKWVERYSVDISPELQTWPRKINVHATDETSTSATKPYRLIKQLTPNVDSNDYSQYIYAPDSTFGF